MIPASVLLQLGKEAQDLIQAWADPEKTKGFFAEANDLASNLWNASQNWPEIKEHWKEFFAWISQGMTLETMREYMSGDWVEWDLPIFNENE